jgi:hypothetical protein
VKTLSIDLDDELCAYVCADSAKLGISVSHYVSALLNASMKEACDYEEARKVFFTNLGRRTVRDQIYR